MDDSRVLQFQYMGKDVTVLVDDIDRANLIDLVIEYWEKAKENNVPTPTYPTFKYGFKMKHVDLKTDSDLVSMWAKLPDKKEIYICVGEIDEPTEVVQAARSLILGKKPIEPEIDEPTESHVHTIGAHKPPVALEIDYYHEDYGPCLAIEETWADVVNSPIKTNWATERGRGRNAPETWLNISPTPWVEQAVEVTIPNQADELTEDPTHNQPSTLSIVAPLQNLGQFGPSNHQQKGSFETNTSRSSRASFVKKRVPRTTAKRKGIVVSVSASAEESDPNNDSGVGSTRRSLSRSLSLSVEKPTHQETLHDGEDDQVYSPSESDSDTNESVDTEDGLSEDEYGIMIEDHFDAYDDYQFDNEKDEDNYFARLYNNGEVYEEKEFGKIVLKPWHLFLDKQHLRDVVRDYCIQCGFSVIVDYANNQRYTVRCSDADCNWRLHASVLPDCTTWAIKLIENPEHTCQGLEMKNDMVNVKWAVRVLMDDIRANNDIPAKALNELLWQRYGVEMYQSTLYRARTKALQEIHGGHDESYRDLPVYCDVIKALNPNSLAFCAWNPENHPEKPLAFSSIFISFRAALDGLITGCRSLIGVDGAHLKGNYGGVLLSAVALDANNEIFPIAWAIVSGEDAETWKFFIWHLKNALKDSGRGDEWCIISDRQKGIDVAITDLWPRVGRRYCCKHLLKNFKGTFPGLLMFSLFWKACGAYNPFTFRKAMEALQKADPATLVWFSKVGPQSTWSKHAFNPIIKSDLNKSNFVKSFNATLGVDRCRPVLTLLEGVRRVTW